MYLPKSFVETMQKLLSSEWPLFLDALQDGPVYGLRVNTLKISVEEFLSISPFPLQAIPWSRDGFYISKEERPGKHPYYSAGLYYIQEPSAMLPAEILDVKPGERVLDLCAAPGGKSAQLAAQLQGDGILISNDINSERTKALAKNLALLGVQNAVILNENPQNLAKKFVEWFDAILVDAPCSGEGMFRRDEQAPKSWELYGPRCCVPLQREILEYASKMLKPGGRMVYSTCTFSPSENEEVIAEFLTNHSDFELVPINKSNGLENGRPEWGAGLRGLENTLRVWPHKAVGEGHFVALLKKKENQIKKDNQNTYKVSVPKNFALWEEFSNKYLRKKFAGRLLNFGEHLYLVNTDLPDLAKLKIVRPGLYLGEIKRTRFEPAHTLALCLTQKEAVASFDISPDDPILERYFKGETLTGDFQNGWLLITVAGFGIGWAKGVNGVLKNHYPKGWRKY